MVQKLLEKNSNGNMEARNCLTPLHLAAQGDHVEVARFLLLHGCNLECKTKVGVGKVFVEWVSLLEGVVGGC